LAWPARPSQRPLAESNRSTPSPWLLALVMLVVTATWFGLFFLPQSLKPGARALIPMTAAALLALGTGLLLRKWSLPDRRWTDSHSLAVIMGSLPANMLFGSLVVTAGNRVDQIGQVIGCSITLAVLARFASGVMRRESVPVVACSEFP
jgi:hypothetical protein